MAKVLGTILGVFMFLIFLVILFDIALGSIGLCYWLITGEFFHILDVASAASTF